MKPKKPSAHETYLAGPTPAALRAVVDEHGSFIDSVVHNMVGKVSPVARTRADLLAAEAITKYDSSRGIPLKNWIAQGLLPMHRVAKQVTEVIGVPEQVRRESAILNRARGELSEKLMREPSQEELADHTGIPVKRQSRISKGTMWTTSEGHFQNQLEAGGDSAEDNTPGIPVDPRQELHAYLYHDLDDTDRQIFQHRTGFRGAPVLPNHVIAAKLNLTPSAVSQRAQRIQSRLEAAE